LQDPAGDAVRIAERVRPPVLEVAAVAVLHEAVRDPNRRAAIRDPVVEPVDRLRLVEPGEPHVVVGAVDGDVVFLVGIEGRHQRREVLLAAGLAHVPRREVRVQSGPVPVELGAERLAVPVDVDAVALAEPHQQVARDPEVVGGALRALAEDLELPLPLRDLGVDPLEVDPGREAEVDVLVDDPPREVANVLVADAGVVLALGRGEALLRKPERGAVPVEEVLLLEAEPRARVVRDRCAAVRWMRRPIREQHFAHDEECVLAGGVGEQRDRLQEAVRARAIRLPRRAAVEGPERQVIERRRAGERDDLRLAAQVWRRLVSVEPDVLELELGHRRLRSRSNKKGPTTPRVVRPHCLGRPPSAADDLAPPYQLERLGVQAAATIPRPIRIEPPTKRWKRAIVRPPRRRSATEPAASAYRLSLMKPSVAKVSPKTSTCTQTWAAFGSTNCGMNAKMKTIVFGLVKLTITPCA